MYLVYIIVISQIGQINLDYDKKKVSELKNGAFLQKLFAESYDPKTAYFRESKKKENFDF